MGNRSATAITAAGMKEGTTLSSSSPPSSFVDILNSSNYNQHRSCANGSSSVVMNGGYKQHHLSKQQQHHAMISPKMSKQHIYSAIGSLEHSYGSGNSGPLEHSK